MAFTIWNNKRLSTSHFKRKMVTNIYHGDGVCFDLGFRYFAHVLVFLVRFEEKQTSEIIGTMRSWKWQRENKLSYHFAQALQLYKDYLRRRGRSCNCKDI